MIGELVRHFFQRHIDGEKIQFPFYRHRFDGIKQFKMLGVAFERVGVPCLGQIGMGEVGWRHARDIHQFYHSQSHAAGRDQAVFFGEINIAFA